MKELDTVLHLRREIDKLQDRLQELKIMTQPKAQTISDMPRGGERKNTIEEYVMKSEELNSKLGKLEKRMDRKWRDVLSMLSHCEITDAQCVMLRLRFYCGYPWKKVVKEMKRLYTETTWNENKVFSMYRRILYKIDKRKHE